MTTTINTTKALKDAETLACKAREAELIVADTLNIAARSLADARRDWEPTRVIYLLRIDMDTKARDLTAATNERIRRDAILTAVREAVAQIS